MDNVTVISKKTPKVRRPVEKKVYFLTSSLKKKPIELSKTKKFSIGRKSKNNLPIKEGTISDVHASIKWDKSAFKIKDERSTNGTFVNGKRIDKVTSLKNGDKIKLGKFVLKFGVKTVREKKDGIPSKKTAKKKPVKKTARKAVKKSVKKPVKKSVKKGAQKKPAKKAVKKAAKKSEKKTVKKAAGKKTGAARKKAARKKSSRILTPINTLIR